LDRRARGATRERTVRELGEALEALASDRTLEIILEDLHWADVATLDFLGYLARRRATARLLIVGTYRPVDAILARHPLRALHLDLQSQGLAREITLELLTTEEVGVLLTRRLPGSAMPRDLATLVAERTDGSPLFVTSLVDWLVDDGYVVPDGDGWRMARPLADIARAIPETVRLAIEAQILRVPPDDRELLAAASVAGVDFAAAEVAAALALDALATEARCEALTRTTHLLRPAGSAAWPDGTTSSRYAFCHALHRDVLYQNVPAGRRAQLHGTIGERLEVGYGARPGDVGALLARHFLEARDDERAARALRMAAEAAARRSAHAETLAHADRAREILAGLPVGPLVTIEQLQVEVAAAPSLMATHGYASPEAEQVLTRARKYCRALGDGPPVFPVLWGLWAFRAVRGQLDVAAALADECLGLATLFDDRDLLLEAYHAKWVTCFFTGDFAGARHHLDAGLPLYDRGMHHSHVMLYGQDPGVAAHAYDSVTRSALGKLDQALVARERAEALARELDHPASLVFALHFAAWMHEQRAEFDAARACAEEVVTIASEHGLPFWHAAATWFVGRSRAGTGDIAGGLADMEAGVAALRATGAAMGLPGYLTTLAETHRVAGHLERTAALLDQVDALMDAHGEVALRAEVLRARGDLHLAMGGVRDDASAVPRRGAGAAAEAHYLRALEHARGQGALSLELRAAARLARLWQRQRRTDEARNVLGPVVRRFTEGFTLPEYRAAATLLVELGGRLHRPAS
jgi:predicted ATPase